MLYRRSCSPSSFSLYRIVAAAMSARAPFRGTRGRRSFSDHRVVSGDSHFQSVRDTNSSLQNRHGRSNNNGDGGNNTDYRRVYFCYDNLNSSSGYNRSRNNGSFRFQSPPQPQSQPQPQPQPQSQLQPQPQPQFQSYRPRTPSYGRPNHPPARPRPADYRIWEFAKHPPPSHSERFVVLSYNLLADYLATNHRTLYWHIPRRFMSWHWRKRSILFELGLWSADIMCFQEVDKFHELEEDLKHRGYSGIWKMRTGEPIDGCAIFWRTSRFKLVYDEYIEFNKLGMRDNVTQLCVLESVVQNKTGTALSESSEGPNRVVICNIHVLYNPKRGEIKLGQVRVLLERAEAVSKKWDDAPVVLCGDFNCIPKSPLYDFLSEQKLDICGIDRDKVSGQASAEIRSPPRQFGHQPRGPSTDNMANPATNLNNSVDVKQTDSLEKHSASGSLSTTKESSQGASEKFCDESFTRSMSSQQGPVKSFHNVAGLTEEGDSAASVSTGNLNEGDSSHTNKSTDDILLAESADQLASKTQQDPEFSSSVNSIDRGVSCASLSEEHVLESCLTSEHTSRNFSDDRLSPSADDFDKGIEQEDSRKSYNSSSSLSRNFCGVSCSESPEVDANGLPSHLGGATANPAPTSIDEPSETNASLALKSLDENLAGLSLGAIDETSEDNEELDEDAEKMSELNDEGDAFPSNLGEAVLEDLSSTSESEAIDAYVPAYDPSRWTPMEIATATGNSDNTVLEHSLKLRSTYTEVEDRSGTRDSVGEPLVTSYNSRFMGTVDYIWRSEGLHTVKVLAPIPKNTMQQSGGFPTKKWGSDHIALAAELAFKK